ncbi:MAG: hypothetical protein BZ151_00930 [Desulfobacca sp. 4484_104]|nr:MAG: hypothetical protein BZ151_00930 [Desulfobacca sp. 4484_104]RLA88770.1 MAG: hypothetical protein DRG58_07060 [Deltaproteobacteria bacterium]
MRKYLPDVIILVVGLGVMVLLLYLGALSEGWVALVCFLAVAVVYHGWYQHLLRLARRSWGGDEDEFDDQPPFPG